MVAAMVIGEDLRAGGHLSEHESLKSLGVGPVHYGGGTLCIN